MTNQNTKLRKENSLRAKDRFNIEMQVSENKAVNDKGFLVLTNVPAARSGIMEYYGFQMGFSDSRRLNKYKVHKTEENIFTDRTLKSFESAAFTDEHPQVDVTASNFNSLSKGYVTNARIEDDTILVDIIVTDKETIGKILNKEKNEVSVGADYHIVELSNGDFEAKNMRVNHVSLVSKGREVLTKNGITSAALRDSGLEEVLKVSKKEKKPKEENAIYSFGTEEGHIIEIEGAKDKEAARKVAQLLVNDLASEKE